MKEKAGSFIARGQSHKVSANVKISPHSHSTGTNKYMTQNRLLVKIITWRNASAPLHKSKDFYRRSM